MLWYCTSCTAAYAPGLARCPQCGESEHTDVPPDQRPAETVTVVVGEPGPEVPAGEIADGQPVKRRRS